MPGPQDPIEAIRARIRELDEQIVPLAEERARLVQALVGLTGSELNVTVNTMPQMEQVSKVRRSAGASKGRDPLAKAANAKLMTMADLAAAVDVTPGYLSMVRSGKRSISRELAERIEKLTGFKATPKNWPTLRDASTP